MEGPDGEQMEVSRNPHISSEFEEELRELKMRLLLMASKVENLIASVIDALVQRNSSIATSVIERDKEIDALEKEIDELSIRILALRQPAASDLRRITTALKVVTDLERVGDLCVNIAKSAIEVNREPQLKPYVDIPAMAVAARDMVRRSLDAFVEEDPELAKELVCSDLEVDRLYKRVFSELVALMIETPATIAAATHLLLVAKHLERIGDHATNIAEQVIFLVLGRDVRHEKAKLRAARQAALDAAGRGDAAPEAPPPAGSGTASR
jgi:phosphate transport system protein